MKDNRYTRALDSLTIDETALENGLKYAREHSKKEGDKVIYMKNNGRFWKTAAIAASLAVIIGVGGTAWTVNGRNGTTSAIDAAAHTFTVTAGAEELRRDVSLSLGEMRSGSGGIAFLKDENAFEIEKGSRFTLRVEGEDIESVTFSTEEYATDDMSMRFMLRNDFASLTENNGVDDKISEHSYIPGCTGTTTFTVPYECQLTEEDFGHKVPVNGDRNAANAWGIPAELYVLMAKVPAGSFYEDYPDYIHNMPEMMSSNLLTDCFMQYFNENSDIAKIKLTVNYKDGASQTEVISLSCGKEEYETGWYRTVLYATLGDTPAETYDTAR